MMDQCEIWPYLCQNCVAEYLGQAVVEATIARTDAWQRMFLKIQHDRLVTAVRQFFADHPGGGVTALREAFPQALKSELLAALDAIIAEDLAATAEKAEAGTHAPH
jgi:hypothetical protein